MKLRLVEMALVSKIVICQWLSKKIIQVRWIKSMDALVNFYRKASGAEGFEWKEIVPL